MNSEDKILIRNIIFISKYINNILPLIFKNCFIFCSEIHNYDTTITQFRRQLIILLNLPLELTPLVKNILLKMLLTSGIKLKTC